MIEHGNSMVDQNWGMAQLRDDPTVYDLMNAVPGPYPQVAYTYTTHPESHILMERQHQMTRAAAGHVLGGADPNARYDLWNPRNNAEGWREVYGNFDYSSASQPPE
jgi:hypothetical protein